MPYSAKVFDSKVQEFVKANKLKKILDVGAGAGKYWDLLNGDGVTLDAIEPYSAYVGQFNLPSKYENIFQEKAVTFMIRNWGKSYEYDAVILGDVLEHMRKSDGLDFINAIAYHTKYIIAVFPTNYLQDMVQDNILETHVSRWGMTDFDNFEMVENEIKDGIQIIIAKGLL
jgi:2-polyprenyl-3-methyl-5-hydroxy-6-metoxy-1,4-benzoquinol methylase